MSMPPHQGHPLGVQEPGTATPKAASSSTAAPSAAPATATATEPKGESVSDSRAVAGEGSSKKGDGGNLAPEFLQKIGAKRVLWVMLVPLLGCIALLVIGALRGELSTVRAALWIFGITAVGLALWFLASVGIMTVTCLRQALAEDGPPRFERHWGGLSGSGGGWSLSKSFLFLIALIVILAAFVALFGEVRGLSAYLSNSSISTTQTNQPAASPADRRGGSSTGKTNSPAPTPTNGPPPGAAPGETK